MRFAIRIENGTTETRHVVWLNWSGERSSGARATLAPGEHANVRTWSRHPWTVLNDNAECVGIFDPGWEDETVENEQ
ncbi:MAG: hypothetical protein F4053_08470 [Proteobacteria bacterium]|nr:hypothetical protein [Pseudomonadota bacterium]MYJ95600.1 hypothetical protein [Pseudomonadota bacterium]